jgi:hypothetical protein
VDHRHLDEHLDLFRDLDALRGQPVRHLHSDDSRRRRRPQPTASELLDGDPSAVPLHGVRRLVRPVRHPDCRSHHGAPRQRVGSRRASLVDDRLDVPVAWPAPRLSLVV